VPVCMGIIFNFADRGFGTGSGRGVPLNINYMNEVAIEFGNYSGERPIFGRIDRVTVT